jgi:ubiquinone/menaquinone biosynthesis C-methylase UbiE
MTDSQLVARRYDRLAWFYDLMNGVDAATTGGWRRSVWSGARGRVLEVGVGGGVNFAYHPPSIEVVGIDVSARMLSAARRRAAHHQRSIDLREADVQALPFRDETFDSAVATFVFCSVPDPLAGLREVRRALVPGGRLLLLEHVISPNRFVAGAMRLLDPMTARLTGAHIARDTVATVRAAGFDEVEVKPHMARMVVEITASRS